MLVVVFVVCCVGSGLCVMLTTLSGESYRWVSVSDIDTSKRRPQPEWVYCVREKNILIYAYL